MPNLYGLDRNFYAYISDNGTTYQVGITDDDAAAGGFGAIVAVDVNPGLPRGWVMRKQYGLSSTGIRTKTPVASASSAQWTTPSNFTKHLVVFAAEGCIGERRINRS